MRLPTYDELASVEEQLEVLEYPLDQPLFVVGPPGSGKTVLAIQRARMVAELYGLTPLITYNRMLRRLLDLMGGDSVKPQTAQSFVWRDYQKRTGNQPLTSLHDPFEYRWVAMLEKLQHDQRSNLLSQMVIDEGQDLPEGFFVYASRHVAQTMTVFADDDQALGEKHTTLEQIKDAAGLDDPIILDENHRNTPQIARLAEHFHSGRLPAATVRRSAGELPRLMERLDTASTARFVSNWYRNRGGSVGVIVERNDTGREMRGNLADSLPNSARVNFYDHQSKNEDLIDVLQPGITVLNKESVKGQEFDAVFILELECFLPCTSDAERRAMYMMCARARDHLFLIHGPSLSVAARAALPRSELLEGA